MLLIDEGCANKLHKSIIIEELSSHNQSIMKLKKTELVAYFLEKIDGNDPYN